MQAGSSEALVTKGVLSSWGDTRPVSWSEKEADTVRDKAHVISCRSQTIQRPIPLCTQLVGRIINYTSRELYCNRPDYIFGKVMVHVWPTIQRSPHVPAAWRLDRRWDRIICMMHDGHIIWRRWWAVRRRSRLTVISEWGRQTHHATLSCSSLDDKKRKLEKLRISVNEQL